jgi:hypothetical protein
MEDGMSRKMHRIKEFEVRAEDGRSCIRFSRWDAEMQKTEWHRDNPSLKVTIIPIQGATHARSTRT